MGKLKCLVVADPSDEAAITIVEETERLASERLVAVSGEQAIDLVTKHQPEAILLSLEIQKPEAKNVIKKVLEARPGIFVVATFRELAVPTMDKFDRLGVEDFIPQPIDFTQLFRAASNRFNTAFRRHTRYRAQVEVYRADGVWVGRTADISEGGLMMTCEHPVQAQTSLLIDLMLPGQDKLRTRCLIIACEGKPPKRVTVRGQFENLRGNELKRLRSFLAAQKPDDKG